MLYCDYETYCTNGGEMRLEDFSVWCLRASRKIDRLTNGRANRYVRECAPALADACGQIAELLKAHRDSMAASFGLSSVSNDGYSESYVNSTQQAQSIDQVCYGILADALGPDRYGLLYAGVYSC